MACLSVLLLAHATSHAQDSLQERASRAQQDRTELRKRIGTLHKQIEQSEVDQKLASGELRKTEEAISDISRHLQTLQDRQHALQASLTKLEESRHQQNDLLQQQQEALARQLRAQYASGLSPWTALLSGRNPQQIGRELAYLEFIARARQDTLNRIRTTLERLASLGEQTTQAQSELADLQKASEKEQAALQKERDRHRAVLTGIQDRLRAEQEQARTLQARDATLGRLIEGLRDEIAAEEARRKAREEARRKAEEEARRKAEEDARRKAAAEEQERRAALEAAKGLERPTAPPSAADDGPPAEPDGPVAPDDRSATERSVPPGGFPGLHKGLPLPVSGAPMQGRFGATRPDGGIWRGVVLRAKTGAPVRAVAAGRVVFARWLSGFGNLLIVDHGEQYLSIYGYNDALLKDVGDIVEAGDTLARVGATGGQVESGLYFELRHEGAPINPELWLNH